MTLPDPARMAPDTHFAYGSRVAYAFQAPGGARTGATPHDFAMCDDCGAAPIV